MGSANEIMRFFEYGHLPPALRAVSEPFGVLATQMDAEVPNSAEKSAGLRKLLEAKDCFVRAALPAAGAARSATTEQIAKTQASGGAG